MTALVLAAVLASAPSPFVVRNVRVFDGEQARPSACVFVDDGTIREVGSTVNAPAEAPVVEGAGRTLLPGLLDAHVHVLDPEDLKTALSFGITTELDMFTLPEVAATVKAATSARRSSAGRTASRTFRPAPSSRGSPASPPSATCS